MYSNQSCETALLGCPHSWANIRIARHLVASSLRSIDCPDFPAVLYVSEKVVGYSGKVGSIPQVSLFRPKVATS